MAMKCTHCMSVLSVSLVYLSSTFLPVYLSRIYVLYICLAHVVCLSICIALVCLYLSSTVVCLSIFIALVCLSVYLSNTSVSVYLSSTCASVYLGSTHCASICLALIDRLYLYLALVCPSICLALIVCLSIRLALFSLSSTCSSV